MTTQTAKAQNRLPKSEANETLYQLLCTWRESIVGGNAYQVETELVAHARCILERPNATLDDLIASLDEQRDYLPRAAATRIRVFHEGDHWAIDGSNENNTNYTAEVWTHFNAQPMRRTDAINAAKAFAEEIGRPELARSVFIEDGSGWLHFQLTSKHDPSGDMKGRLLATAQPEMLASAGNRALLVEAVNLLIEIKDHAFRYSAVPRSADVLWGRVSCLIEEAASAIAKPNETGSASTQ